MLPPEIFDKVCSYLQLKDVASLSQVCPVSESAIKDAVLKECPYYDIEYSQWDTWKSCAINFFGLNTGPFTEDLDCPVFIDQPLPDDFECLCKDVDLGGIFAYNDKGLFMEDKFLDLTESDVISTPTPPIKFDVTYQSSSINTVNYDGRFMKVPGDDLRVKCTSRIMAAVSGNERAMTFSIKDLSSKVGDFVQMTVRRSIKISFRLQIVGERLLFAYSGLNQEQFSYIFHPIRKSAMRARRHHRLERAPAGMMLYNGHVFDVIMSADEGKKPVVQSSMSYKSLPRAWKMNRYHVVEQDDNYRQYGLIYNDGGLLSALVDLKSHKLMVVTGPYVKTIHQAVDYSREAYLKMAGISRGSIGLWKYTKDYLEAEFKKQHSCGLCSRVECMFLSKEMVDRVMASEHSNSLLLERLAETLHRLHS